MLVAADISTFIKQISAFQINSALFAINESLYISFPSLTLRPTMPVFYITRKEHFNAAHKLFNPAWTKEKNDEVFGKCANENWHGHNFELFVTVKGEANPDTGFVMDAKLLSKIIKDKVVEALDHKNLNTS